MTDCGLVADATPFIASSAARLFGEHLQSVLLERRFDERNAQWEKEADSLEAILHRWHASAMEGIATPNMRWKPDAVNLLRFCTFEVMRRGQRAGPPGPDFDELAEAVVRELDQFLHASSVEVQVVAELIGLQLPGEHSTSIEFEADPRVELAPLTDELVHKFELGSSSGSWGVHRLIGQCAIAVRSLVPVRFGPQSAAHVSLDTDLFACAQDLLLALQVTHRSSIGAPRIIRRATNFAAEMGMTAGIYGESPRLGVPNILERDSIERCRAVYLGLRAAPQRSMRLACSRLGLSRLRLRPEDAILDAAIGLEAILLSGSGKGELRYQFSLNYALLDQHIERRAERFHLAQRVYDVRSVIAHGGHPDVKDLKRVDPSGTPEAIAMKCQDMLEECIEAFRGNMATPDFLKVEYWKRRALGVEP